jgi:hypothetical protein
MGIGVSIFLIAVGAVLTFALNVAVTGVNLATVGVILMIVGGIGLLWSLIVMGSSGTAFRRRTISTTGVDPVSGRYGERHTVIRDGGL